MTECAFPSAEWEKKYSSETVDNCVIIVVFLNDDGQTISYYLYGLFRWKNKAVKNIRKASYTKIVNYRYMYMYNI